MDYAHAYYREGTRSRFPLFHASPFPLLSRFRRAQLSPTTVGAVETHRRHTATLSLSSALVSLSRTQSSRHSRIDHEQSCALRSVASDTAVLAGIPLAPLPLPPPPPLACREQPATQHNSTGGTCARVPSQLSHASRILSTSCMCGTTSLPSGKALTPHVGQQRCGASAVAPPALLVGTTRLWRPRGAVASRCRWPSLLHGGTAVRGGIPAKVRLPA